jgi:hypothetical protein
MSILTQSHITTYSTPYLSALVLVDIAAIDRVHSIELGIGAAQRHQKHLRSVQRENDG